MAVKYWKCFQNCWLFSLIRDKVEGNGKFKEIIQLKLDGELHWQKKTSIFVNQNG